MKKIRTTRNMELDAKEIGERIKKAREQKGVTITQLAKESTIKQPAISNYEMGNQLPSADALVKLSNNLGVSIDFILKGNAGNDDKDLNRTISKLSTDQQAAIKLVLKSFERDKEVEAMFLKSFSK